ncbi:MAG: hypothetical protein KTR31_25550 [Myxococcales bacterium]|nr:hypothetical protein [Myxococcales bacterium]
MAAPGAASSKDAIFVVLRQGEDRWMGRLVSDQSPGQPRLAFEAAHAPSHLPLGAMVTLGVATRSMGRPAKSRAKLVVVEDLGNRVILEVQPDDPTIWAEVMPEGLAPRSDRRSWPRLALSSSEEVVVQALIDAGPTSGRRLAATVLDVSEGGAGLRFVPQAEARLCQTKQMICVLDDVPRLCMVRHRRLVPMGVRYGVAYVDGEVEDERFEAHWVCPGCGTTPLLADAHAHCPACGTPRDEEPTHFPDWDSLVATAAHPFNGVERSCLRCGSGWSSDARNCGHCGTRLPSWES